MHENRERLRGNTWHACVLNRAAAAELEKPAEETEPLHGAAESAERLAGLVELLSPFAYMCIRYHIKTTNSCGM